ncbi:MAG TPA: hypothetical protein VFI24_26485 [Pyrinomonadaceae bacterium]|nr:hypothetical protein [Pyrinomonadaceae bacterium]
MTVFDGVGDDVSVDVRKYVINGSSLRMAQGKTICLRRTRKRLSRLKNLAQYLSQQPV